MGAHGPTVAAHDIQRPVGGDVNCRPRKLGRRRPRLARQARERAHDMAGGAAPAGHAHTGRAGPTQREAVLWPRRRGELLDVHRVHGDRCGDELSRRSSRERRPMRLRSLQILSGFRGELPVKTRTSGLSTSAHRAAARQRRAAPRCRSCLEQARAELDCWAFLQEFFETRPTKQL